MRLAFTTDVFNVLDVEGVLDNLNTSSINNKLLKQKKLIL